MPPIRIFLALLLISGVAVGAVASDDPPISYSTATPVNRLTRLQQELQNGHQRLVFDESQGYLKSLLSALDIPISSQVLSFSKASKQRPLISPQKPRAIYFSDDAYVGYVQEGIIEIAVADPALGMVFYTLDQTAVDAPVFHRRVNECLTCHASIRTRNVPGVQVRSMFVDKDGTPLISLGSFRVDHTTPLENRWGGWYVTGTHGSQRHIGNLVAPTASRRAEIDNSSNFNLIDLKSRFDVSKYLSPHSDLVALMVLEHQVDVQNLITKANFDTRIARHRLAEAVRENTSSEEFVARQTGKIQAAADLLVKSLLLCNEATFTGPLQGTSSFAVEFSARGPKDLQGRSLRELDLERRLFRYPCSYLIYSESFDALPDEVKSLVYRGLWEVLTGRDTAPAFEHLTPADRKAILSILQETKTDLPDYWKPSRS